ncbi:MAG TPA: hypothetical protein VK741_12820, partial [Acetobacteraceae bacterium]|nr:hypothetical protein [Acetobacteraceae bacterium]
AIAGHLSAALEEVRALAEERPERPSNRYFRRLQSDVAGRLEHCANWRPLQPDQWHGIQAN